jgi:putative phosphoesterase
MFISDVHGSYKWAKLAIDKYHEEKPDKLIILGDILYHGPRNDLPEDYNPKKVIALLNPLKKDIIAVRGNCDAEVDQMVLEFMITSDYCTMDVDNHHFFITHGHLFNKDKMPFLNKGDIFVHGHFHKPMIENQDGIIIINPSSISLPKEGTNSYGIYENDTFIIKDFQNNTINSINF